MNTAKETIEHPGIVQKIHDNSIEVMILSMSACSSCQVKGACNMSEMAEKLVVVKRYPGQDLTIGTPVTVVMQHSQGNFAVFLGYILPFIIVLITLIGMLAGGFGEGIAGLSSLLILIPYYVILYQKKDLVSHKFQFQIKSNAPH